MGVDRRIEFVGQCTSAATGCGAVIVIRIGRDLEVPSRDRLADDAVHVLGRERVVPKVAIDRSTVGCTTIFIRKLREPDDLFGRPYTAA